MKQIALDVASFATEVETVINSLPPAPANVKMLRHSGKIDRSSKVHSGQTARTGPVGQNDKHK
jgi:hypothetical protein